jgi:hypothetical protein
LAQLARPAARRRGDRDWDENSSNIKRNHERQLLRRTDIGALNGPVNRGLAQRDSARRQNRSDVVATASARKPLLKRVAPGYDVEAIALACVPDLASIWAMEWEPNLKEVKGRRRQRS